MKKSILTFLATVSIGAATIESSPFIAQAENKDTRKQTTTFQSINHNQSYPEELDHIYERFLAAGGTENFWENIILKEYTKNSVNNNQVIEKIVQTKAMLEIESIEAQTRVLIEYAENHYGSINEAIHFYNQNGWW